MRRSASREGSDKGGASSWGVVRGEDPDSDDAFRHDDGFDDGFVRSDALFDDESERVELDAVARRRRFERRARLPENEKQIFLLLLEARVDAPVAPRRQGADPGGDRPVCRVHARGGARARARERARDGGEQDGRGKSVGAEDGEGIRHHRRREGAFVENAVQLERASKDAERALDEVHHADAGRFRTRNSRRTSTSSQPRWRSA